MTFLENDVQGSEYICHDLMNDLTAVEDETAESREFIGNAHSVTMQADEVVISSNVESDTTAAQAADGDAAPTEYRTGFKHFREVLEDWEAFILDDLDPLDDSMHV